MADISGMPGMIARLFALPKMRGYGYSLLIASDPDATAHIPRQPGKVTLIQLKDGRVTGISFTDDPAEIEQVL